MIIKAIPLIIREVWPALVVRHMNDPNNDTFDRSKSDNRYNVYRSTFKGYFKRKIQSARKRSGRLIPEQVCHDLWKQQNGRCALTGLAMTTSYESEVPNRLFTNASIDRIDSSKTYTNDNIQLVCTAVNIMKNSLDEKTFIWLCHKVVNQQRVLNLPDSFVSDQYWNSKRIKEVPDHFHQESL